MNKGKLSVYQQKSKSYVVAFILLFFSSKVMSDFLSVNCQTLVRLISDKRTTYIEQAFDE